MTTTGRRMILRSLFASKLFSFLELEGISYVVVGDTRDYPCISSDIDIVIEAAVMPTITQIIYRFCKAHDARVIQILRHEQASLYFVCALADQTNELHFIQPDICSDYLRCGQLFLKADELLNKRTRTNYGGEGAMSFYVPAPPQAFIYYLLKKIDKKDINNSQGSYLTAEWNKNPDGAMAQLLMFLPVSDATLIANAAKNNAWSEVSSNLSHLQKTLRSRLPFSVKQRYWEIIRRVLRVSQPTGMHVAFLGADGAGKSTIIEQLERDLAPAFRNTKRYHLRPFFGRHNDSTTPVIDPHGKPLRNTFSSLSKLGLWWLDYVLGYSIEVFPRLVRSTLVLFDRYYYDLLVDHKRYRYGGSLWLAGLVGAFIPRPDLVIFLDAPAEVLRQRKQEVPAIEINRQRTAYQELIKRLRNGHLVDASLPFDKVLAQVEKCILDFMERRTAKRLKMPILH